MRPAARAWGRGLGIWAGTLLLSFPAHARIINVLSNISGENSDGFDGSLTTRFELDNGNTERTEIGGDGVIAYRAADNLVYLIGKGAHLVRAGEVVVNRTFAHLRYRRTLNERITLESFAQHEFDEFRRLNTRGLLGVGAQVRLLSREGFALTLGSAYMAELELIAKDSGLVGEDRENLWHRWSNYLQADVRVSETLVFTHTTFAQPRFDDFDDIVVHSENSLVFEGTSWLSVKIGFTLRHDNRPPDGVKKRDTSLSTSFVFSPPRE